jgi:hypothetical protein
VGWRRIGAGGKVIREYNMLLLNFNAKYVNDHETTNLAMKYCIIIILCFVLLAACNYRPSEKRLAKFQSNDGKILTSVYKKKSDTIEFKRILTFQLNLTVQSGQIFPGEYALIHQRFKEVARVKHETGTIDSLINRFSDDGFVTTFLEDRDVMFIQIVPDSAMDNLEVLGFLNLRQEIEGRIDERLADNRLGEWFAGDLGAGANMLFFIDQWDQSLETVMEVLREENLLGQVLIAKRIMTSPEDWSYEVVYPLEYEGVFNQM